MTSELRIGMQVHTAEELTEVIELPRDTCRAADTRGEIMWISHDRHAPRCAYHGLASCLADTTSLFVGVRHEDGTRGVYRPTELGVFVADQQQREVATIRNELTPTEQLLGKLRASVDLLEGIVARHDERLRLLQPPGDPAAEEPAGDTSDPLKLAQAWRELVAADQESICEEIRGRSLTRLSAHYGQATADALGAVELLAVEVERLRGENQSLRAAHDSRRARVAQAVERLREVFPLRAGCDTIEDAVADACEAHGSALWSVEGLQRLTRQLAELAGEDPDEEHEPDDLIEKVEQQLADTFRERTIATQQRDSLIAGVARLKPWAELAQQLRDALSPGQRTRIVTACRALALESTDSMWILADAIEQLGSLDATTAAQDGASEPAEEPG